MMKDIEDCLLGIILTLIVVLLLMASLALTACSTAKQHTTSTDSVRMEAATTLQRLRLSSSATTLDERTQWQYVAYWLPGMDSVSDKPVATGTSLRTARSDKRDSVAVITLQRDTVYLARTVSEKSDTVPARRSDTWVRWVLGVIAALAVVVGVTSAIAYRKL